ncbi:MAG TPA: hypothetical protein VK766_02180 [Cytophagaceae bacterium]|jgi:hypothetical protein|nr:hypothetical protein [Cytophagaceae bacterium]
MQFVKKFLSLFLILIVFLSFSIKESKKNHTEESGVFSCYINGKPFVVDSMKACIRMITGGEKQLTLNNERFVKFAFMNPSTKNINLESSTIREAYIRYEDPASSAVGIPVKGFINILNLDEKNKILNGEFEMELKVQLHNTTKILKVTNGKFSNIPIVFK